MKQIFIITTVVLSLISCKESGQNEFTVSGKITNANGKMLYLEEVQIGTMQPTIVDSVALNSDGTFSIKTETGQAAFYNLRIDQNRNPVVSVINDKPSVKVDVVMSPLNNQFPEKYEITGSPASQTMKTFITTFNDKLQNVFAQLSKIDSLYQLKTPDSIITPQMQAHTAAATSLKDYAASEIKKSDNAALTLFELGYYQSTANNPNYRLEPLSDELVKATISDLVKKNPDHTGIASLHKELQAQMDNAGHGNWIGKPAPEFTLPDVNGRPVALSSFKGKYVLVDFWASWCGPCRKENPHIVRAYDKFKDKNFTILGVSLDKEKEPWLDAIKKDNLSWAHVSDLKYWQSSVVPLYGFDGIPFNVLIDPSGKIIAQGLRGAQLESKLAEVLK